MTSTTGTNIETYLQWLFDEISDKEYGEVAISFTLCKGQIVRVNKSSTDTEQIPLKKKHS